jgi:NAD(P)-dependent dehydrogenase (short-subunit alcohol dehydrogenase family)
MSELRFDGRVVIVTGAGRGVGRGHALLFAARGAKVVVADLGGAMEGGGRSSEVADAVVKQIVDAGGEAVAVCASVAEEEGANLIVQTAIDAFGRVDTVVNNAGIAEPESFANLTLEDFQRMNDVHYMGTVLVCKAAYPHMVEAGYGRIVNTTSEGAFGLVPKAIAYGGAKAAVFGFSRELGLEGAKDGILVNMLAPRAATRMSSPAVLAKTWDVDEETYGGGGFDDSYAPERVAPAAVFLGHESCTLNGVLLIAGGNQVMRMALVQNQGFTSDDFTPEDVAANLDTLMDLSAATELEVLGLR